MVQPYLQQNYNAGQPRSFPGWTADHDNHLERRRPDEHVLGGDRVRGDLPDVRQQLMAVDGSPSANVLNRTFEPTFAPHKLTARSRSCSRPGG